MGFISWINNLRHKQPEEKKEDTKKSVSSHVFFYEVDRHLNLDIDKIKLENKSKEKLVKEFLKIILTIYRDNFNTFIEDPSNFENSHGVQTMMDKCIVDYRKEARNRGIPEIFLEKFDYFYNQHFITSTEFIKSVCDSRIYPSEDYKIEAVMDSLNFTFKTLILTVESTINGLNGELEKALIGTKFDVIM